PPAASGSWRATAGSEAHRHDRRAKNDSFDANPREFAYNYIWSAVPRRAGGGCGHPKGIKSARPATAKDFRGHQRHRKGEEQVKPLKWIVAASCAIPLVGLSATAAGGAKKASKEPISFGTLRTALPDAAKAQVLDWLRSTGKTDPALRQQVEIIWSQEDRTVLERVADTLTLCDPDAAKLLAEARDPSAPAPQTVPAILKDKTRPAFYRSNLALAYAKALGQRRVHEETLDSLKAVKPEDVVDPGAYFFTRAVSEHALILRKEAERSIVGIVEDVADAPERYRTAAVLMLIDMGGWKDKDLGDIARKMDNSERRLALARGGPQTQKIQKDIVLRL